ncbi:MAG: hypothetical protein FWG38_10710, partial [Defluviitaleaceae bacterium]|nr:hypothetical protein [Defluviitaleaceae bacterium]
MSGTTTEEMRRLDSPVRMILCGCNGRMGTAITNMVEDTPGMEIVLGVDRAKAKAALPYPVQEDINNAPVDADVVVSYLPPIAEADTLAILD